MPNHIGSLLNKKEHLYVLTYNYTPQVEAVLSQWVYLTLCHGRHFFSCTAAFACALFMYRDPAFNLNNPFRVSREATASWTRREGTVA